MANGKLTSGMQGPPRSRATLMGMALKTMAVITRLPVHGTSKKAVTDSGNTILASEKHSP